MRYDVSKKLNDLLHFHRRVITFEATFAMLTSMAVIMLASMVMVSLMAVVMVFLRPVMMLPLLKLWGLRERERILTFAFGRGINVPLGGIGFPIIITDTVLRTVYIITANVPAWRICHHNQ